MAGLLEFARLLRVLGVIFGNWNRREFQRSRNSALAIVIIPLFFIIPGAFLGGWNWGAKVAVIQIGMWISVFASIWLAWRRVPIGAELSVLLSATDPEKAEREFTGDLREGVYNYIRLVAAILASEIAAGFIALWLPAHQNPAMALILLPVTIAFVTYTVWQDGRYWWPALVHWLTWFTLTVSVFAVFLPDTAKEAAEYLQKIDGKIVLSPQIFFLIAAAVVAVALAKFGGEAARPLAKFGIIALAAWWLAWGPGGGFIKERAAAYGEQGISAGSGAGFRRVEVRLKGGDQWVRVAHLFPPCTQYKIAGGEARGGLIRFADGSEQILGEDGPDDLGRRDPVAMKGEGVIGVWVGPVGDCRRSRG